MAAADLPTWIERLLAVGVSPNDPEDAAIAKGLMNASSLAVASVSPAWWITMFALGRPWSAAIPLVYQAMTYAGLAFVAAGGRHRTFALSQMTATLVFPALLMWSLGGFVSGGAMILWSVSAVVTTQIFSDSRWTWTIGLLVLAVASAVLDPWLVANVEPLPEEASRVFFLINLVGLTVTVSIAIRYFMGQRDKARAALHAEQRRSETLLRNVLPEPIADRLKAGESPIADAAPAVTVLFADIVGFTPIAADMTPTEVVNLLNHVFTTLDQLAASHGLEKIKTIGDEYMVLAGLPEPRADHSEAIADFALDAIDALAAAAVPIQLRIGIETGPVVAGVIGETRFAYDIWGDTVNVASRMESQGVPGRIHLTGRVIDALGNQYDSEVRGTIDVKGKGPMETYFLLAKKPHDEVLTA